MGCGVGRERERNYTGICDLSVKQVNLRSVHTQSLGFIDVNSLCRNEVKVTTVKGWP